MKRFAALTLLSLGLLAWERPASACARHLELPPIVVEPTFTGGSQHAALVKPLRVTKLEQHGRRYWRAAYEIVKHRPGVPVDLRYSKIVIVEWACDPLGGGADVCGAQAGAVLPGFGERGEPQSELVQLELELVRMSSLDGSPVFVGSV